MTWNWQNIKTSGNRVMAYWLRRQGWVCFYLDEQSRTCTGLCWLEQYQASEKLNRG